MGCSVSSGADPGEWRWRCNSLKAILLKISLLRERDEEQIQKLSSRPGLIQAIDAVGCFGQVPALSYYAEEELRTACQSLDCI